MNGREGLNTLLNSVAARQQYRKIQDHIVHTDKLAFAVYWTCHNISRLCALVLGSVMFSVQTNHYRVWMESRPPRLDDLGSIFVLYQSGIVVSAYVQTNKVRLGEHPVISSQVWKHSQKSSIFRENSCFCKTNAWQNLTKSLLLGNNYTWILQRIETKILFLPVCMFRVKSHISDGPKIQSRVPFYFFYSFKLFSPIRFSDK